MVTSSVAPAVRCTDLSVVRGGSPVLTALSLDVAPGQVTGLLGPSGCGKTTLMRSIVGTQVVRDGTVTVLGHPAGAPQLRRSVGLRDAVRLGLRRPHGSRERPVLRGDPRREPC